MTQILLQPLIQGDRIDSIFYPEPRVGSCVNKGKTTFDSFRQTKTNKFASLTVTTSKTIKDQKNNRLQLLEIHGHWALPSVQFGLSKGGVERESEALHLHLS